jgi:hypothetical protein
MCSGAAGYIYILYKVSINRFDRSIKCLDNAMAINIVESG